MSDAAARDHEQLDGALLAELRTLRQVVAELCDELRAMRRARERLEEADRVAEVLARRGYVLDRGSGRRRR